MGNANGAIIRYDSDNQEEEDLWWTNGQRNNNNREDRPSSSTIESSQRVRREHISRETTEQLNEFKLEFARKHEKRRQILDEKRKEMQDLRAEVLSLRKENQQLKQACCSDPNIVSSDNLGIDKEELINLKEENTRLKNILLDKEEEIRVKDELCNKNRELRISVAEMQKELQNLNIEVLDFEKERQDYQAHVTALKDVIAVSKQMLLIREAQLKELREKVDSIEKSLAGKEVNILSQDLRSEYERQLQNIRNLRSLYEERQAADRREKQTLLRQLEDVKKELESEKKVTEESAERIKELEEDSSNKYDQIKSLESDLGLAKAESRQYQSELTVINQLFSEILLGFNNTNDINLDELTKQLEEHHELLQNIVVNEVSTEVSSALPKMLLDLVNQAQNKENEEENELSQEKVDDEDSGNNQQMNSVEEIVENLPKVWRVLIELLSHQKAPFNNLTVENNSNDDKDPCYKVVETPKGPSLVLSVSQTFIRLKDLILEKKSLEKETNHLKQLNGHLENRLQDQEKRLEMVTKELSKTWHVVGKLQKQHHLLHTQEKILRYELAQKRKLLTTLREELEYSREKWQQAREKNSNTEEQWKKLRTEFASRKKTVIDDYNNSSSIESGYSDEREGISSGSDDEPGYETDVSEYNQKLTEPSSSDLDLIQNEEQLEENIVAVEENLTNFEDDNISTNELNVEEAHSNVNQEKTDVSTGSNEKTSILGVKEDTSEPIDEQPSTSSLEERLAAKDERLRKLEGQCQQLVAKVTNTTNKSLAISNKLDNLHEVYGESSSNTTGDSSANNNNENGNENQD